MNFYISFSKFFSIAMNQNCSPYPYQMALASAPWPDILTASTASGKTAGTILSWLFKRIQGDPDTPRRLVYCLPTRVLVEQTEKNVRNWIENINKSEIADAIAGNEPIVAVLMGGKIDKDWDQYPEKNVILIGTQDQLLSRALNRGYNMSRFRWPVQFGLLNNDCMWVMDEVQLMGSGLATTIQLQAFRSTLGTILPARSLWMSATLHKGWFNAIDFADKIETLRELRLSMEDHNHPSLKCRFEAPKTLERADCPADNPQKIAEFILGVHQKGTRTLVVVNTVKRAKEIYKFVKEKKPKTVLTLIHSQFRPVDRQRALKRMLAPPDKEGTICISTQVVEAGVDFSATTLITDLAPWSSLVQRFGRCNREGLDENARVIWLKIDLNKKGAALPYTEEDLRQALLILEKLTDVGPVNLPDVSSDADYQHVLRRKDIFDLFDTTPDLSGMDIDVSRFIRDSDDHDVNVFWRKLSDGNSFEKESLPSRDELCSVSIKDLKAVKDLRMWRWDHLEKIWHKPVSISPGMTIMLNANDGCYSSEMGWTGQKKDIPEIFKAGHQAPEADDDDFFSSTQWQSLSEHTELTVEELNIILSGCNLKDETWNDELLASARHHDVGKAHEVSQKGMNGGDSPEADASVVWAKTANPSIIYERKGFRHELASALAMLENGMPDLAAYLVAAHHGKVRLSIRSLPHEKPPADPNVRFARGIWEGDILPEVDLGGGVTLPETVLDLSYMEFGEGPKGESWLARMLSLRDDKSLGPFRLAYLEALLRAADWRASKNSEENDE